MHGNNFGFKSLLPCQISFAIDGEKVIREKLLMDFFFREVKSYVNLVFVGFVGGL